MTLAQEIGEGIAVNAVGWGIVFNQAKWNAYIGDPANVVSLCIGVILTLYTMLRIIHLIHHWNHHHRK